MKKETKYSLLMGLKKSVKNAAVVFALPALMHLLNTYADWLPQEYWPFAAALGGVAGYMVKNYLAVKGMA